MQEQTVYNILWWIENNCGRHIIYIILIVFVIWLWIIDRHRSQIIIIHTEKAHAPTGNGSNTNPLIVVTNTDNNVHALSVTPVGIGATNRTRRPINTEIMKGIILIPLSVLLLTEEDGTAGLLTAAVLVLLLLLVLMLLLYDRAFGEINVAAVNE